MMSITSDKMLKNNSDEKLNSNGKTIQIEHEPHALHAEPNLVSLEYR